MRHALIIAGGSGTRLWPMSRAALPKQLIPFIKGRSLLQITLDRLQGLIDPQRRYVCAGEQHRAPILGRLSGITEANFLGEPMGRDTLNAVALAPCKVIARRDPDAVIAVFTADHVIQPIDKFQRIIEAGYALAESRRDTLVTFGITPSFPATGYGYLQLGVPIASGAFIVDQYREKPDEATARAFLAAGPDKYLWSSGMFVLPAATIMDCIRRYEPATHAGLERIAAAWETPQRTAVLAEVYPTLRKISVDFAVMEPASRDPLVRVAAVPMDLSWMDVGSWPTFAQTCEHDQAGNALAVDRHALVDTKNTLVASSDPSHLITTIGCEDLIIIHTPDATLVCRADRAEDIKKLHALIGEKFGKNLL